MKINVLLADESNLVRAGIRSIISGYPDIEVTGEAENGVDAVLRSKELNPDVVIVDSTLPFLSGADTTGMIKKNYPEMAVVVLFAKPSEDQVFNCLRNGASSVLYKNTTAAELAEAIRNVFSGKMYIGKKLAELVIENIQSSGQVFDQAKSSPIDFILTKRERQILFCVAEGLTNSQIAEKLVISPRTVDSHKTHLMQKLNLTSSSALRKFAFEKLSKG